MGVTGGRRAREGVVHVKCPLEAFAVWIVSHGQHLVPLRTIGSYGVVNLRELAGHIPVSVPGSSSLLLCQ